MMKLTLSLISLAAILSMLVPAYVYGQSDFRVFVLDDDAIRELDLKATQDKNGQVKKVSGFSTKAESVVQINQGENLRIFASDNDQSKIEKVKIIPQIQGDKPIKLTRVGSHWSVQGIPNGVYVLDVIARLPDGSKGAYETVLVILAPYALEANPVQVIKQVTKNVVNVDDNKDSKCPRGYAGEPPFCTKPPTPTPDPNPTPDQLVAEYTPEPSVEPPVTEPEIQPLTEPVGEEIEEIPATGEEHPFGDENEPEEDFTGEGSEDYIAFVREDDGESDDESEDIDFKEDDSGDEDRDDSGEDDSDDGGDSGEDAGENDGDEGGGEE